MTSVDAVKNNVLTSPQRILERAIEVLEESGEAGIRTHQIAEDCGVTAPILYRAFGNREGLIIAAQAERYRRSRHDEGGVLRDFLLACTNAEEFSVIIELALRGMLDANRKEARRLRAAVHGSAMTRPELERQLSAVLREVVDEYVVPLEFARARGWLAYEGDLATFVAWWGGCFDGRLPMELEGAKYDTDDWDALLVGSIMHALFGHTGTACHG